MRCVVASYYIITIADAIRMGVVASSKMNLYKSLRTRLSDEHSALDHRAKELRDASQSLVRDSGTIGGALGSHEIDARVHQH